jgi:hypothetical protein
MPTIATIDGLRVVIYPNDHRPAHVHVIGRGHEAVFVLHCPGGPPELRENHGYSRAELVAIAATLNARLEAACLAWSQIHGPHRR